MGRLIHLEPHNVKHAMPESPKHLRQDSITAKNKFALEGEQNIQFIDAKLKDLCEKWLTNLMPAQHAELVKVLSVDDGNGEERFIKMKQSYRLHDYADIVKMVEIINRTAKAFYTVRDSFDSVAADSFNSPEAIEAYNKMASGMSDQFYKMKEYLLAKAVILANTQAPSGSYGIRPDKNIPILYFDIPGYEQLSFHLPGVDNRFSQLRSVFAAVPQYPGDWNNRYKGFGSMGLGGALAMSERPPHAMSYEQIVDKVKQITADGDILTPEQAHYLYNCARVHSSFTKPNKRRMVEQLLFPHAPTVPGAFPDAYATHGETILPDYDHRHGRAWREHIELSYGGIMNYLAEIEALVEHGVQHDAVARENLRHVQAMIQFLLLEDYRHRIISEREVFEITQHLDKLLDRLSVNKELFYGDVYGGRNELRNFYGGANNN